MYTSAAWINDYLDPAASAEEQAELLTRAGFPLEGTEPLECGDARQDYEMTSNRGDCVSHFGLAREIAAISGRTLKRPSAAPKRSGPAAETAIAVTSHEHGRCPLYTARVIRGVTVGPSPRWLARKLEAIGQIPRNNIVDASNFVLFELGQPTHVFDLATLEGPEIVVRMAREGERILPIGEGAEPVALGADDLVIADARRPVAIAGVKGGAETAISDRTTDIVIEAASFDPVSVRNTSRRLGIESDSSFRFERGVHPGQVDFAADRLAQLILEVAGGKMAPGSVSAGAPLPDQPEVTMRIGRCTDLLGIEVEPDRMVDWLERLEFAPRATKDRRIVCTVPVHRLDVDREVDLVEEVARMRGLDVLPVADTIQVRVAPLQPEEMARRAVASTLAGLGFVEAVTHSLVDEPHARAFLLEGHEPLVVEGFVTVLRPSVLPSLLRVLAHNRDNGVHGLRLFEHAPSFSAAGDRHEEQPQLAMVMDLERLDEGLRPLRGVIERLARLLAGPDATVEVTPDDAAPWLRPGAMVSIDGRAIGRLGLLSAGAIEPFGLDGSIAGAELALPRLYDGYPPDTEARALPSFPAVERDVSAVVDAGLPWSQLREVTHRLGLEHLEGVEFVTSYRGKQIGAGRKSVTVRLRFRAPDHTLTHEAVDRQVASFVTALENELSAEIRR